MASVVTQGIFSSSWNFVALRSPFAVIQRSKSSIIRPKQTRGTVKNRHLIQSDCQSLADRGFLRCQKPYEPSSDVRERIDLVFRNVLGADYKLTDTMPKNIKYTLLTKCWKEFDYCIPNSKLHQICTYEDVLLFYTTPVKTTTPFDELAKKDLPPNLHVQYDYHRFDPETDTKFDGISAYPESPTIITGLKSRKKYKGVSSKLPSYYYNEAIFRKPVV